MSVIVYCCNKCCYNVANASENFEGISTNRRIIIDYLTRIFCSILVISYTVINVGKGLQLSILKHM